MVDGETLPEVEATLHVNVIVECPACEESFDLMDKHNEEGETISQACPDGCWSEEHKKFEIHATCPDCGACFTVKGLHW